MRASKDQTSSRITLFGIALIWLMAQISLAVAHDFGINRGGYRNPAGEWCCGDNDCASPAQIAVTGKGWVVGTEFVPFEEATPSPDGQTWICRGPTTRAAACSVLRPVRNTAQAMTPRKATR